MYNIYTLNLSTKALNDTRKALAWYRDISFNLEDQLLNDLDQLYQKLRVNPFQFGFYRITKRFRYVQMKRFPYYILFTTEENKILIAGIVHTARSPWFVRNRYT